VIGIGVVAFTLDDYWGRYYVHRPWYGERHRWYAPPPYRGRPVPPLHDGGSRWHQQPVPRPHQAAPVTRSPHAVPPGVVQRQPPTSRPGELPDRLGAPGSPGGWSPPPGSRARGQAQPSPKWQRQPTPGGQGRPPAGGQRNYP
jgi:hypothetical protein